LAKKRTAKIAAANRIEVWPAKKNRPATVRGKRCAVNNRLFAGLAESEDANAGKECCFVMATAGRRCLAAQNGLLHAGSTRLPAKSASNARSAVDKPLHIHRMRCAEHRFLKTGRFFSNIRAGPIQSLSRALSMP
jgi:hypothetical protein